MSRKIMTQSHENLFRYHNFVLEKKLRQRNKWLNELEIANSESQLNAIYSNRKKNFEAYEKIEFEQPDIKNQTVRINYSISNLMKVLNQVILLSYMFRNQFW